MPTVPRCIWFSLEEIFLPESDHLQEQRRPLSPSPWSPACAMNPGCTLKRGHYCTSWPGKGRENSATPAGIPQNKSTVTNLSEVSKGLPCGAHLSFYLCLSVVVLFLPPAPTTSPYFVNFFFRKKNKQTNKQTKETKRPERRKNASSIFTAAPTLGNLSSSPALLLHREQMCIHNLLRWVQRGHMPSTSALARRGAVVQAQMPENIVFALSTVNNFNLGGTGHK